MSRNLIGDTIPDESSLTNQKDIEERRRKLISELNSSGKYYAFKEKLKVQKQSLRPRILFCVKECQWLE